MQAILDARDRLIVPGLINAHYHSHDTLCRGMFEELPLEMWLLYTLPMGANRSKEELRERPLVGAVESLRCGITTVQDMLGLVPLDDAATDVVIQAYRDVGIRGVFSPMVWDIPPIAMVRNGDDLPAVRDALCATSSTISSSSSTGTPRLAHCLGRWRRLRRNAARRRCCRAAQSSPKSAILPSTLTSMRPAASC